MAKETGKETTESLVESDTEFPEGSLFDTASGSHITGGKFLVVAWQVYFADHYQAGKDTFLSSSVSAQMQL